MTLAIKDSFTVIDFETTGVVQGYTNEPWQIGMVQFNNGKIQISKKYNKLIHVGKRPFNLYAPGRHQQLIAKINRAESLQSQWTKISPMLTSRTLVAHNVATEKKILHQAFPFHQFGPWIDTLTLSRIAYPSLPDHKLENLIHYLHLAPRLQQLCPNLEPHDAFFDAIASATVLEKLLTIPSWQNISTHTLINARPVK
ncbi:MAG: 3'-5' exonuclease [Lentisphaeria bacterium]